MKRTFGMISLALSLSTFSYQGLSKVAYTALSEYNKTCSKNLVDDQVEETLSNDQGDYLVMLSDGGSVELKKAQGSNYNVVYVDCR